MQDKKGFYQGGAYPQGGGQAPFPAPGEAGFSPDQPRESPAPAQENPQMGYPFDEQDFFTGEGAGQTSQGPQRTDREDSTAHRKSGLVTVLMTFAVLCVAVLLLNAKVLRLRTVTVNGLSTLSVEQVAEASGLKIGTSFLSIDESKVRAAVESNRYLVFEKLERHFPNAVTLTVRERKPLANLMVMGVMYILDDEGMVLERKDTVALDNGLLTVTGLQTKEARLGRVISPQKRTQMESYSAVLDELVAQNYTSEIAELNLSDLDSLYLITVDGYTVNIGDKTDVRAKIGTVRAVIAKLKEMGKTGGVIDATVPGEATYSPPNL